MKIDINKVGQQKVAVEQARVVVSRISAKQSGMRDSERMFVMNNLSDAQDTLRFVQLHAKEFEEWLAQKGAANDA